MGWMGLQSLSPPALAANRVLFSKENLWIQPLSNVKCTSENRDISFRCSSLDERPSPSNILVSDARIIYCTAPALGHNKESHPESNLRVPAITNALNKMELTPKFRGSEVIELKDFQPASVDDIARVHTRSYVAGLEKAMSTASQQGLIFIDGSGPTYATKTVINDQPHFSLMHRMFSLCLLFTMWECKIS